MYIYIYIHIFIEITINNSIFHIWEEKIRSYYIERKIYQENLGTGIFFLLVSSKGKDLVKEFFFIYIIMK